MAVLRNLLNPVEPEMNTFLNTENLTNLIIENTCFKGADSCIDFIDLILRNSKYSFQYSSSVETGLSDHHHLIFSMMKTKLALEETKRLVYRNFKNFSNDYFEEELSSSSILITRTTRFLRIILLMFLINMHLKRQKILGVITNYMYSRL